MESDGEEPARKKLKTSHPSDESTTSAAAGKRATTHHEGSSTEQMCPYLGTINRHYLDFDFEKVCSVTLSNHHVYCCLVCGKYLQGRGPNTHAFTHALQESHFVFMDLKSGRVSHLKQANPSTSSQFFCLPDNYEILDESLADIRYNLHPSFTRSEVDQFETRIIHAKSLDGSDFTPGLVGINAVNKFTDYANVVIQLICTIVPLRNFFLLLEPHGKQRPDSVVIAMSDLVKKIFNARNFKGIVCPHEFLQAISLASNKQFSLMKQSNAMDLLSWLINHLHMKLRRGKKNRDTGSSARLQLSDTLRGSIQSTTCGSKPITEVIPFFSITLDVPAAPIFKSTNTEEPIPQVHIFDLLDKFGGQAIPVERKLNAMRRLSLRTLPEFLVIHLKRFSKNAFFVEKNPTIVKFPAKDLDLAEYVHPDFIAENPQTRYDLVANVVHVGNPQDGCYKIQIHHEASGEWYEVEDLRVSLIVAQQVAMSGRNSFEAIPETQEVMSVAVEPPEMESKSSDPGGGEVDEDFDSFLSDVTTLPVRGLPPPKSSGLLSATVPSEVQRRAKLMATFEVSSAEVEWGSGTEQVERILKDKYSASHFDLFMLPPYATEELIKRHYKKLSVLIHPDKCQHPGAGDAFFMLTKAYEELLKPEYRAKYADVIEEAKQAVLRERKKENKLRQQRGEEPLGTDDAAIRSETIARCDTIVKEREDRLAYADRTRRENELRQQRMEAEMQAEEYRKQIAKKKWVAHREERVGSWRDFRENVVTKKARINLEMGLGSDDLGEDYKKAWR